MMGCVEKGGKDKKQCRACTYVESEGGEERRGSQTTKCTAACCSTPAASAVPSSAPCSNQTACCHHQCSPSNHHRHPHHGPELTIELPPLLLAGTSSCSSRCSAATSGTNQLPDLSIFEHRTKHTHSSSSSRPISKTSAHSRHIAADAGHQQWPHDPKVTAPAGRWRARPHNSPRGLTLHLL